MFTNTVSSPLANLANAAGQKKDKDIFTAVKRWLLLATVFLMPVFFFPLTSDIVDLPKRALFLLLIGLFLLVYLSEALIEGKISFYIGRAGGLLLLFVLVNLVSIYMAPNSLQSFVQTGLFFIFAWLMYIFIVSMPVKKLAMPMLLSFILSVSLLSLFSIYQYLGATEQLGEIFLFGSKSFTPAGSSLTLLSLLLVSLPLTVILALRTKDALFKVMAFLLSAFQLLSLVLVGAQSLPRGDAPIQLLPLAAGWNIAVDSFKIKPFFGFGPDNFLSAFTIFRPAFLNLSENLWTWRFFSSSNMFLHVLSTLGILGLTSIFLLLFYAYKKLRAQFSLKETSISLIGIGLVMLFVVALMAPYSLIVWMMLFVFLALLEKQTAEIKSYNLPSNQWIWVVRGGMLVAVLALVGGWFLSGKAMLADVYYKKSQDFLAQNKGMETYDYQLKAMQTNARNQNYHIAFSNVNFALANSLSTQQDLTDQDKQQVTVLVQQAIQEAKVAINLNQQNIYGWENLANLYRQLINFAQDADQWTIAAYQQAIALNPTDPRLRLDLGGVFFGLQNYESATDNFKQAIQLKNNYANAYYNLAAAYSQSKEYTKAYLAMQQVASLIDKNSDDYTKVSEELAALKELVPQASQSAQIQPTPTNAENQLTEPQALPTRKPESQIKLPEDAGPQITPSPTETPTPPAGSGEATPSGEGL